MTPSFKERVIEEFDALCPESGKWKVDRNIARTFLYSKLEEAFEAGIQSERDRIQQCMQDYHKCLIEWDNKKKKK